jgi:methionyl-tRNA formyltransferase
MMNTSAKIIFFGTEDFSLTTLTGLIEAGYDIAAVVTKPDTKRGRGRVLTAPSVKVLAERHNIPVWQPAKLADITGDIQKLQPVTGVLVSYGKIIPQPIIDLFAPGIINLHPSLLPLYRGPSPIESAIINGDSQTGVSIMQLSAAMDAGPVYTAKVHPLTGTETKPELYHALATIGTDLLIESLPSIIDGSLQPTAQDEGAASYSRLLTKNDSLLDLAQLTAEQAERRVRAYLGYPKSKLTVLGHEIIITKAHVGATKNTPLDLICQDGAFLSIDELVSPTGRRMTADAFLNGYASQE